MKQKIISLAKTTGDILLWTCVLAGLFWAFGAIWYLEFLPRWLRTSMAVAYLAGGIWLFRRYHIIANAKVKWARPVIAGSVLVVYGLTLFLQPTNDRTWASDQERLPEISIDGEKVTIRNFRDFRYITEVQPVVQYKQLTFQLSQLESAWFLIQRFTRFNGMAHTFVSFGLDTPEGKKYFSISVEIRREEDELYSPLRGIYRSYELMYVVGSEQDLVGVRTNVREKDRVFLYRVNANAGQVQQLFRNFAERIETLRVEPEFYSTFTNNCTNNIVAHTWDLTPEPLSPFSPRIVLPGYSAIAAFNYGLIGQPNQSFSELQATSRIDQQARRAGISASFSNDIRTNHNR